MHSWLRMLGVSRAASLVGGVAYLLTPTLVTLVVPGNDGKLMVTALAPLLFWAVEWVFRRRDLVPLAAEGAIVALVILTTQFQMAYFLFGAAGTYAVFRAVQEGAARGGPALRRLALFVLFSVLGAGVASVQLIPAVAYLGPAFAALISGSFIVETIFQVPGMGQHFVNAATTRDEFLLLGVSLFFGFLIVVMNLLADILTGFLDPRVRA